MKKFLNICQINNIVSIDRFYKFRIDFQQLCFLRMNRKFEM